MSQQNVEVVRAGFEAFNSGGIARILAFAHPEFEAVVPPELSAEPDIYRGHDGIRRYFESFQDAMDEIRFEPVRFWEAGSSVVVDVRITAKGRQTAIPVVQRIGQVWRIRDGRALSVHSYVSTEEALEAVGLAEEAGDAR
jgi:ketosteroid isomerase-like protein